MSANPNSPTQKPNFDQLDRGFLSSFVSRVNAGTFLLIWAAFIFWAFLIVGSSQHSDRVLVTTVGTISGPMVGAIARNFQPCCLTCSLTILPYSSIILLLGISAQFLNLTRLGRTVAAVLRIVMWIIGWLGWFLGGTVSFVHAVS